MSYQPENPGDSIKPEWLMRELSRVSSEIDDASLSGPTVNHWAAKATKGAGGPANEIWADVNATDWSSHQHHCDAPYESCLCIGTDDVVTFGNDTGYQYTWVGPKPVILGPCGHPNVYPSSESDYEAVGSTDHAILNNRDAAGQHPQGAITGLTDRLDTDEGNLASHVANIANPHQTHWGNIGGDPLDGPYVIRTGDIMSGSLGINAGLGSEEYRALYSNIGVGILHQEEDLSFTQVMGMGVDEASGDYGLQWAEPNGHAVLKTAYSGYLDVQRTKFHSDADDMIMPFSYPPGVPSRLLNDGDGNMFFEEVPVAHTDECTDIRSIQLSPVSVEVVTCTITADMPTPAMSFLAQVFNASAGQDDQVHVQFYKNAAPIGAEFNTSVPRGSTQTISLVDPSSGAVVIGDVISVQMWSDNAQAATEVQGDLVPTDIKIQQGSDGGASPGTDDHRLLNFRDAVDQHPMSAITGLGTALNAKLEDITGELLGDLSDVSTVGSVNGNTLVYNGGTWSAGQYSYNNLSNTPSSFPPSAHTHPLSEVTDNGSMAYVDDAQQDGQVYGRENGAWSPLDLYWEAVGGGIAYNDGNVGIGVTPTSVLHVKDSAQPGFLMENGSAGTTGRLFFDYDATNSNSFYIDPNGGVSKTAFTLGGHGRVGIGRAPAAGSQLAVQGNIYSNGTINSAGDCCASDIRMKQDIKTLFDAEQILASIRGVRFNWKEDGRPDMGVIAQELEAMAPELVQEVEGVKHVNYNGVIGILVQAVKELTERVRELEA